MDPKNNEAEKLEFSRTFSWETKKSKLRNFWLNTTMCLTNIALV